jgi:hypothetical protein
MVSGDNAGKGVHRLDLDLVFAELALRLRKVRVCCGDWTRVLGNSTLGIGDGPSLQRAPARASLGFPTSNE